MEAKLRACRDGAQSKSRNLDGPSRERLPGLGREKGAWLEVEATIRFWLVEDLDDAKPASCLVGERPIDLLAY